MPSRKDRIKASVLASALVAILSKVKISSIEMYEALKNIFSYMNLDEVTMMILRQTLHKIPGNFELKSELLDCIRYIQEEGVLEDRPASYREMGGTSSSPAVISKETSTSDPLPELASSCSAVSKETTAHAPTPELTLGASSLVNADVKVAMKVASPAIDEECVHKEQDITFQAEQSLIVTEDFLDTLAIGEILPHLSKKQEESDIKVILTSAIDEVCVPEEQDATLPEGQSSILLEDAVATPAIHEILRPVSNVQGEYGYALAFSQDAVIMLSSGASLDIKRGDQLMLQGLTVVLTSSEPTSHGKDEQDSRITSHGKDEQESGIGTIHIYKDNYSTFENMYEKSATNLAKKIKMYPDHDVLPEMASAVIFLLDEDEEPTKIEMVKQALDNRLKVFEIPDERGMAIDSLAYMDISQVRAYIKSKNSSKSLAECCEEFKNEHKKQLSDEYYRRGEAEKKKKMKKTKKKQKMVNPTPLTYTGLKDSSRLPRAYRGYGGTLHHAPDPICVVRD